MSGAVIAIGSRRFELVPGDAFTFGRSPDCTVCLDASDTGISRLAGSVGYDGSSWWLTNRSGKRSLALVDELGLRAVLPPGRRAALEKTTRVLIETSRGSHCLTIEPNNRFDTGPPAQDEHPPGDSTVVGAEVNVSPADRLAMVALFAGYLADPPCYDPHPRSYDAAAARLGWTRTQVLRRVEYLRARLTSAGVPNLTGPNALEGLAEFALTSRLITRADLALLRR
ncbi:MAG: hypothetical protein E6F99_29165 [Actinobacteria bacterium]|nr:MAG: hypothetical protein E6F99_29165 [Actinomycetota bacterium]